MKTRIVVTIEKSDFLLRDGVTADQFIALFDGTFNISTDPYNRDRTVKEETAYEIAVISKSKLTIPLSPDQAAIYDAEEALAEALQAALNSDDRLPKDVELALNELMEAQKGRKLEPKKDVAAAKAEPF